MKLITYIQTREQIPLMLSCGIEEVIIEHEDFSKFGNLGSKEFLDLSKECRESGLRVVFNWDISLTEDKFEKCCDFFSQMDLGCVDAIRVQDFGALEFVFSQTSFPIQIDMEGRGHNRETLLALNKYIGDRIDRVILSAELPSDILFDHAKVQPKSELLGFGQILLSQTKRHLISFCPDDSIHGLAHSEESAHKNLPVVQNRHGTFMFYNRVYCLLSSNFIINANVNALRIDLRFWERNNDDCKIWLTEIISLVNNFDQERWEKFKPSFPEPLTQGLYNVNKTDILFSKLKNPFLSRESEENSNYIGDVIHVITGEHMAIKLKRPVSLGKGQKLLIVTPEGRRIDFIIERMKSFDGIELECVSNSDGFDNEIVFLQHAKRVSVKSSVYA